MPPSTQRGFALSLVPVWLWIAVGSLVVISGLSLALKVQTDRLEAVKAEYAAFVAEVKAKGEAQEQKTRETIERQKRESSEAEKRSQRALADIRSKYDRLRNSPSGGKLPAIPGTAPVADDGARDTRLLEVLRIAEEQTRQLEELQAWVRANRGPP